VGTVSPKKELNSYIQKIINKLPDNKIYLTVSGANGLMNCQYYTSKLGDIISSKKNMITYLKERGGKVCHYMWFNNKLEAENCKNAMLRPLLRFPLKLQTSQKMPLYVYKYIPDIDWSDPRVVTDEGLLEVCGCPKDKAKEYAEYCKKYMEEFDKKKAK